MFRRIRETVEVFKASSDTVTIPKEDYEKLLTFIRIMKSFIDKIDKGLKESE